MKTPLSPVLLAPVAALVVAALGVATAGPRPARAAAPVLVELFTSQGCSSCPPADSLLKELSARSDVIALSFHVDYWDRLGWRDPFASAWNTRRQQDYRTAFGLPYVYTPQMVIGGRDQAVGSDRAAVGALIERQRAEGAPVAVHLDPSGDGAARLVLPARPGLSGRLTLFGYERERGTEVRAGENSGRRLLNTNVVSVVEDWGVWSGEPVDRLRPLPEPKPGRGYALVLTEGEGRGTARVLGAALLQAAP